MTERVHSPVARSDSSIALQRRRSSTLYVGCAGWVLPPASRDRFPVEGSHLARYAARFHAAEINSSFYGPHRRDTYRKWASSVPRSFRFSVKVPKQITHEHRLLRSAKPLDRFIADVTGLGVKLGCLLVQLPPSLEFKMRTARSFFSTLRAKYPGHVVVEPRHATWFTPAVDNLLATLEVARVAADPALVPAAGLPGGWPGIRYFRLHGSPRMYYSSYQNDYLDALALKLTALAKSRAPVWCMFDNTAYGVATGNALDLLHLLHTRC